MKKVLLAGLAVGTLVSSPLAAQETATVTASATILPYLEVTKVSDLDFGSVNAGTSATLTPGTLPGSGTLGIVQIDHNSEVSVGVSLPAGGLSLVGGAGTEPPLPVNFSCGYSAVSAGALDGAASACPALANRIGNGDGSSRTSYIQVGGEILAGDTSSRIPGTYTGQLTFTVTSIY